MRGLARAAQPAWEAMGFAGRAKVMLRMQKWMGDNAERVPRASGDEHRDMGPWTGPAHMRGAALFPGRGQATYNRA